MNRGALLIIIGTLAFSITLGIIVGLALHTATAQLIGLSVAVGATAGVITGTATGMLIARSKGGHSNAGTHLMLTEDQAQALYTLLEGQGEHPEGSFTSRLRPHRQYQAVGGASLADGDDT